MQALARRAVAAGVDLIQIREKDLSGRALETLTSAVLTVAAGSRTRVLVNDRLDVALGTEADGIHLPANGLLPRVVRSMVPDGFVIGVSTHSLEEARAAAEGGASFIVFGPVFETSSKPGTPAQGIEALARVASGVAIPVFALGGIGASRVRDVAQAGASGVAAVSAFVDPEEMDALLAEIRAFS